MGLGMSSHPKIADFGIRRDLMANKDRQKYGFLETWADLTNLVTDSQSYVLFHDDEEDLDSEYTINVAERTMVIFSLFLEDSTDRRRYTKMRGCDVVVDSWLSGGGRQPAGKREEFRYLGISGIIEELSAESMDREIEEQLSEGRIENPPVEPIEMSPDSTNWATNTWIRCAMKVAGALSTPAQQITASRAWIVLDPGNEDQSSPLNLVVEFTLTIVPEDP